MPEYSNLQKDFKRQTCVFYLILLSFVDFSFQTSDHTCNPYLTAVIRIVILFDTWRNTKFGQTAKLFSW